MGIRGLSIKIFTVLLTLLILTISISFSDTNPLSLTSDEQLFISQHPTINLGVDPTFIPYEFFDTDGVYKGIAADYLQLISAKTGITFVVEEDLTWTEAYEKAIKRELDVLPCVSKTKEREQYFLYSSPYYAFQRVVFINSNNTALKNFSDLANKKIAVQEKSSHHSYLKEFPEIELSLYKTVEEALEAVSSGAEIAFVGNQATASYLMKSRGITNLQYFPIDISEKQTLHFAVRKDWPTLVTILDKALDSITSEEKITIDNRWLGRENQVDYSLILKIAGIIGAAVLLILGISYFWIIKLNIEIQKRKQTELDLLVAKDEAIQANLIKSTFLARMSHEVRTPLNAIMGMTYIIKKTDLSITQKVYLEKISRATHEMLGIINDILDFSKIEADKIEIEQVSFNLDEMIEHIISIVSYKIEEQKIEFSMHKNPDIPTFFLGDSKRLGQVLLNLISNALKFTHDGAVSFSIHLVAQSKNSYTMEFSIKDTGIGMSNDQMDQLFTPFKQADSTISRRFGGTGLGLSITKLLVEKMGGTLMVYSELGEGSTFNVRLTLEEDRNKEYEERKKWASVYFQNIRVLVVEKSFFYTNLLKEYLNAFNIVAEFAQSEEKALRLLHESNQENSIPYNLLILDYETPEVGGIAFYKELSALPWLKEQPKTILLIPLSHDDLYDKLEKAGLDLGISKPIIPSVLYNGILETFKLNVLAAHELETSTLKPSTTMTDYPYHLLIVDDNKTNQFIAQSILEQAGFTVTLSDNGKECLQVLKDSTVPIHLILMDLHMPVMNGYEATAKIRETNADIPIIAMSADAILGIEEKCKAIGFTDYISKPFEPDFFVQQVLKNLEGIRVSSIEESPPPPIESNNALNMAVGLKHIGGNESLYKMILTSYYDENRTVPQQLRSILESSNIDAANEVVHKIKSSSGSIGATKCYDLAVELQKSLHESDRDQSVLLIHAFINELENLFKTIDHYLKTP